jgi:hypothetical protein
MAKLRPDARVVTFGLTEGADVTATELNQEADLSGTRFGLSGARRRSRRFNSAVGAQRQQRASCRCSESRVDQAGDRGCAFAGSATKDARRGGATSTGVTVLDDTYNSTRLR